jgi:hypothetical protein
MDPLDHEYAIVRLDLAGRITDQSSFAGLDLTRLQRASEGAGQSAGRCSDYVIEGRRVLSLAAAFNAVMVGDLVVDAEEDRLRLGRDGRPPKRPENTLDPHP